MKAVNPDLVSSLKNRILLEFEDARLEKDYLDKEHESTKTLTFWGIFLAFILLVSIPVVDTMLLPSDASRLSMQLSLFLVVPAALATCFVVIKHPERRVLNLSLAACCTLMGCVFSLNIWLGGEYHLDKYITVNMVMLFVYFVLSIPFRMAAAVAWTISLFNIIAVFAIDISVEDSISIATITSEFLLLGTLGAYRLEWASRRSYLISVELESEYRTRSLIEREKNEWLESIADFLRHELRNAMIGIASSLQLIGRKNNDPDTMPYIARAEKSVDFMRSLLHQASHATSLEKALTQQHKTTCNLSVLVKNWALEYKEFITTNSIDLRIEDNIIIDCDQDNLIQVLDKLVNNAVEHSDQEIPIQISLSEAQGQAILTVSNSGDALPEDVAGLFLPFKSSKSNTSNENMGLGLFVVQKIVKQHEGIISARQLSEAGGAEFTVCLPMATSIEPTS